MDIRDPTLVDIRRQPLGSSRDKPGKERGRALYTKRSQAQAAVAGSGRRGLERAGERRSISTRWLFRHACRGGEDARLVALLHRQGVFAIPRPGLGGDAIAID